MSDILIHTACTGIILLQNILVRCGVMSVSMHCATALLYTIIDTPFLVFKSRSYSIAIHHAATIYLLLGAIHNDDYINSKDLMLLESTTFFNMLHKLHPNDMTKTMRNVSWFSIRLVFLPLHVLFEIYKASIQRYDIFLMYSHGLMTLMVLSLEWTNEIMKTNIPCFSLLYYIIPIIQTIRNSAYTYTCMLLAYVCLSIIRNEHTHNRFEDRILFKGFQTYMMLKVLHL